MARRREMIPFKGIQPIIDDIYQGAGYLFTKGEYSVTIGPVTLWLTKEEKDATLLTWSQLENGIDPSTGLAFNPRKLELCKKGEGEGFKYYTPEETEEFHIISAQEKRMAAASNG